MRQTRWWGSALAMLNDIGLPLPCAFVDHATD
jgi:hypothetical protein